jgi:hypothetical protein
MNMGFTKHVASFLTSCLDLSFSKHTVLHILGGIVLIHLIPDHSLLYNGYLLSFPEIKRPGRGADHPTTSSVKVQERVELYTYSPCGIHDLL